MEANRLIKEIVQNSQNLPENVQCEILDFIMFKKSRIQAEINHTDKKIESFTELDSFSGILKNSPNFNDDPLEIQRRMRNEWD